MGELEPLLLGHLLDFEREDAQLVEHGFHTVGQHAQIFGTDEHTTVGKHLGEPP